MRLRNPFKSTKAVAEFNPTENTAYGQVFEWRDPLSENLRCQRDKVDRELAVLQRRWDELADDTDLDADEERQEIRPQVKQLRVCREDLDRSIQAAAERTELVAELVAHRDQVAALRDRVLAELQAHPDVPEPEKVVTLFVSGRAAIELEQILLATTGNRRFARVVYPIKALREAWQSQHEARIRMIDRVLAPGGRPKMPVQPWDRAVARLRVHLDDAKGERK